MLSRFFAATRGRTVVTIARRLATVAEADLIVVVAGGLIVEQGTHGELLARGGLYRELHDGGHASPGSVR